MMRETQQEVAWERMPRGLDHGFIVVLAMVLLLTMLLPGCTSTSSIPGSSTTTDSGPTRIPAGVLSQPDPIPRDEPLSASGNSLSYVVLGKRYQRLPSAQNFDETGIASWYGRKFHGRLTASGERYDMFSMTAAHKSIPLPTYARVTNLANKRSVVVRINDRGPFVDDRLIDLSYAAAAKLDMLGAGTANVRVVALSGVPGEAKPASPVPVQPPVFVKPYKEPQPILHLPASQSALLAKSEGRYLQAGAYESYATADELRARLDGSVAVAVFISKPPSAALYRVQVGPFATAADLAAARVTLRERHAIDAIVVSVTEASSTCC